MLIMDLSPGQREDFRRLKDDPVYFYERFFATQEEPYPFPYQKEIMTDLASGLYNELCILKGRQIGMSWTTGALAAWFCSMNDEKHVVIVAFNLDQSQIPLNYAKIFMSRFKKLGLYDMFIEGQSARNLRWNNGSKITSFGCTVPDAYNVRGQKADLLIIDEAAFIYDRMFPSITPTVANTGGPVITLSTAGSIGSYFYRRWADGNRANEWRRKLKSGYDIQMLKEEIPRVKSYIIPSVECPRLTKEKLDAERRGLGEMRYKREYECMWAGTADQVFIRIPVFTLRKMPTRSIKPCYGGIDCGKVNDPTVLIVIEQFNSVARILTEDGIRKDVDVPFRVIYGKTWERKTQTEIAADINVNIHPRFPSRLYSIDATGGFGDELLNRMINYELPCRGLKVKTKNKNEMILGSPAVKGLDDAFAEELLWINNDVDDIIATELLFELNAYIGKLRASGLYTFDSVIDRDHLVDALMHSWSAAQAGSFEPYFTIRKRR